VILEISLDNDKPNAARRSFTLFTLMLVLAGCQKDKGRIALQKG